ncbi:MAG TPA: hypothetical protein VGH28_30830 [Polyangiaceae bacterium]|jgi:hypothetical protein
MNFRILAACAALAALAPSASLADPAPAPPAETVIAFHNDLPNKYRLTHMRLVVDGTLRYDGPGFGRAYLPPGKHLVELVADYQMHSVLLTYLDGYHVEVRSSHVVQSGPAQQRVVVARAIRHGGVTTPLSRSAAIAWVDR